MNPKNANAADRSEPASPLVALLDEPEQADPLAARDYTVTEQESELWEEIVNLDDWAEFKAQHHLEVVSIEWPAWSACPIVAVWVKG